MPSSSLWNLWNCNLDRQRTNRRVAQLPRANISLRHEIYIQRCTLFARNGFEARKTFDRKFRNETNRPCWDANTIDWRISVSLLRLFGIEYSIEKKKKGKREEVFQRRCCKPCMFVTWDPNMARIKGTGQGFSTPRKRSCEFCPSTRSGLVSSVASSGTINVQLAPPLLSPRSNKFSRQSRSLLFGIFFLIEESFIIDIFILFNCLKID